MSSLTSKKLVVILIVLASSFCGLSISNFSALSPVDYLLKQQYVFLHEGGHALLTWMSGGKVNNMVVEPNLGGYVWAEGGNFDLISPAGYFVPWILACIFLILCLWRPNFADIWIFFNGVLSLIVAIAFFPMSDLARIAVAVPTVVAIVSLIRKEKGHFWPTVSVLGMAAAGAFFLYSVFQSQGEMNMALSIGTILGMVFVAVGATTNVVLSLFVLSAANAMLLFQSIFRALPILHGSFTDASIYAEYIGWAPMVIGTTWFLVIVGIGVFTAIIAAKIIFGGRK